MHNVMIVSPQQSTRHQSRKARSRVYIPGNVALTPDLISGTARKFSAADIGKIIGELIDELDMRSGDPDFEPEPFEDGEGGSSW